MSWTGQLLSDVTGGASGTLKFGVTNRSVVDVQWKGGESVMLMWVVRGTDVEEGHDGETILK